MGAKDAPRFLSHYTIIYDSLTIINVYSTVPKVSLYITSFCIFFLSHRLRPRSILCIYVRRMFKQKKNQFSYGPLDAILVSLKKTSSHRLGPVVWVKDRTQTIYHFLCLFVFFFFEIMTLFFTSIETSINNLIKILLRQKCRQFFSESFLWC